MAPKKKKATKKTKPQQALTSDDTARLVITKLSADDDLRHGLLDALGFGNTSLPNDAMERIVGLESAVNDMEEQLDTSACDEDVKERFDELESRLALLERASRVATHRASELSALTAEMKEVGGCVSTLKHLLAKKLGLKPEDAPAASPAAASATADAAPPAAAAKPAPVSPDSAAAADAAARQPTAVIRLTRGNGRIGTKRERGATSSTADGGGNDGGSADEADRAAKLARRSDT